MTGVMANNGFLRFIVQPMLLQHGYCTFVIFLFGPFTRLFVNLTMCTRALFTKSATTLGLVEQAFWRVPLFTEWIGASSFEVFLAWPSRHSTAGTFSSGTSLHIQGMFQVKLSYQIDVILLDLWLKSDNTRPLLQTELSVLWKTLQIDFHKEFSCLPGRLWHSADGSDIPWTPHTIFSSRPDCDGTAEVPSLILRAALSAMPFVSERWGVDVQWSQDRSSLALPNSKELSV